MVGFTGEKAAMRFILPAMAWIAFSASGFAQTGTQVDAGLPKDQKARKSYAEGLAWQKDHKQSAALDSFKKADKQDGGHCVACQKKIIDLGEKTEDYKSADAAAQEVIAQAQTPSAPDGHPFRAAALENPRLASRTWGTRFVLLLGKSRSFDCAPSALSLRTTRL
jgi:hypothetical protein